MPGFCSLFASPTPALPAKLAAHRFDRQRSAWLRFGIIDLDTEYPIGRNPLQILQRHAASEHMPRIDHQSRIVDTVDDGECSLDVANVPSGDHFQRDHYTVLFGAPAQFDELATHLLSRNATFPEIGADIQHFRPECSDRIESNRLVER